MKRCCKCKLDKPIEDFSKNQSKCKECDKAYYLSNQEKRKMYMRSFTKKHYIKNKDIINKKLKVYRDKHKPQYDEYGYKYRYNLTMDQLRQMFVSQNGCCAICNDKFKSRQQTHIDHNHTTGKVRQLLCRRCNTMLGFAKENISILAKAVEYLNKWNN